MLTKKIHTKRIQILVEFAITKKEKNKRDRRGAYHLKLAIPTLNDLGRVEYLNVEALFRPNTKSLFIENTFVGENLNDYLQGQEKVFGEFIRPSAILEIETLVKLAFDNRLSWDAGASGGFVYSPKRKGTLFIRLVPEVLESA